MSNGKTQHDKLDKLLDITTNIRIEQAKVEVRLDNAKEERTEMKKNIEANSKMKRLSNLWDGVLTFAIGVGTYLGTKY